MLHLKEAWKDLREVQKSAVKRREEHLEALADFYADRRNTTRAVEVKKLNHIERVKKVAAKHRCCFKKSAGMIRNLLVPIYAVEHMTPIFCSLIMMVFLGSLFSVHTLDWRVQNSFLILVALWCTGTNWSTLAVQKGWKPLTGEKTFMRS